MLTNGHDKMKTIYYKTKCWSVAKQPFVIGLGCTLLLVGLMQYWSHHHKRAVALGLQSAADFREISPDNERNKEGEAYYNTGIEEFQPLRPAASLDEHIQRLKQARKVQKQQEAPQTEESFQSKVDVLDLQAPATHYVIFNCPYPSNDDFACVFYLPMTVLAWRRVGYASIVICTGDRGMWTSHPTLVVVLHALVEIHATIIFVSSQSSTHQLISRISRLFVHNMKQFVHNEGTFLLTADSDLWPLNATLYDAPSVEKVAIIDSGCCGSFKHKGESYDVLSLSNIGMGLQTWKEVMNIHKDESPATSGTEMMKYFIEEFGSLQFSPESKTSNEQEVTLEQYMISLRLGSWIKARGTSRVVEIPRDTSRDRIDLTGNELPRSIQGALDARLPVRGFDEESWKKVKLILNEMHAPELSDWSDTYRTKFEASLNDSN